MVAWVLFDLDEVQVTYAAVLLRSLEIYLPLSLILREERTRTVCRVNI